MKTRMMKAISMLCLVALLVTSVAACGGGGTGGSGAAAVIDDAVFANYVYLPTIIELPELTNSVNGAVVHGERIFYFYTYHERPPEDVDWETWIPEPPRVIVASVNTDGSNHRELTLPISGDSAHVSALTVLENGNIALVLTEHTWGDFSPDMTLYYIELSQDGTELVREELGLIPDDAQWFQIERALFLQDGRMVIIAMADRGTELYLLDANRAVVGELTMDWTRGAVETADGRVLVFDMEFDGESAIDVLRELDFETGDWGNSFPISISNPRGVFPARESDPFDLIIDDGNFLHGYTLQSGERTPLFNWIEAGFAVDHGYHVGFLPDGRITVLQSDWDRLSDDGSWITELAVLRRVPRSEVPEREVITLGGMGFWGDIRQQVVAFNRESETHRIQVIDYSIYAVPGDWGAGLTRFRADIAAGQGTDMVWGQYMVLATLVDRGLLADLNPFLDADPEIHRADFFQNVLAAMETPDGALPLVGNSFSIQTMLGNAAKLQNITSWTFADMLSLMEQGDGTHLLGQWMTGDRFLSMALMFSGQDFIDWTEGRVNLDNEAFIQLLEVAARLPREWNPEDVDWDNFVCELERMQRGEQLLAMAWMSQPNSIQTYTAVLDDVRALGVPTGDGGAHLLMPNAVLGISNSSEHKDMAWSFIRQNLLPDAHTDWNIPLRISQFDEMMEDAMTPQFWTDEDGNEHEQSSGGVSFGGGLMIEFYAMTEDEARLFRDIVESASLLGRHDEVVETMVQEEILPFFAGDRSAADTARILQNRLQTYLSERMG